MASTPSDFFSCCLNCLSTTNWNQSPTCHGEPLCTRYHNSLQRMRLAREVKLPFDITTDLLFHIGIQHFHRRYFCLHHYYADCSPSGVLPGWRSFPRLSLPEMVNNRISFPCWVFFLKKLTVPLVLFSICRLYPVDKKRVNEFGATGEEDVVEETKKDK